MCFPLLSELVNLQAKFRAEGCEANLCEPSQNYLMEQVSLTMYSFSEIISKCGHNSAKVDQMYNISKKWPIQDMDGWTLCHI